MHFRWAVPDVTIKSTIIFCIYSVVLNRKEKQGDTAELNQIYTNNQLKDSVFSKTCADRHMIRSDNNFEFINGYCFFIDAPFTG